MLDELMLDAEFAPGAPLADVLAISMDVLELEITTNRPDCLGRLRRRARAARRHRRHNGRRAAR